jgi:hypothetical protein
VFSRHAGPGNSLILIASLMLGYRRRPRIVMLAKLQWEPLFDTLLNRLPNRFIRHDASNRDRYLAMIADLAGGLGDQDCFVLFPEGRDFSHSLRRRAIEYLRTRGHHRHAARAERMRRVLPPKHMGVEAAVEAAPEADVVFVAHTVLEDIGSFRDLWSRIPLSTPIRAKYRRIPATDVPHEQNQLIDWLYGWWSTIDGWIEAQRAEPAPPPEATVARLSVERD